MNFRHGFRIQTRPQVAALTLTVTGVKYISTVQGSLRAVDPSYMSFSCSLEVSIAFRVSADYTPFVWPQWQHDSQAPT